MPYTQLGSQEARRTAYVAPKPATTYKKPGISEAQKARRTADVLRQRRAALEAQRKSAYQQSQAEAQRQAKIAAAERQRQAEQASAQRAGLEAQRRAAYTPPPQQVQAEVGQDWDALALQMNVPVESLIKANKLDTTVKASAVYNVPLFPDIGGDATFGGLTAEEEFYNEQFRAGGGYSDFLTHQETLNVVGQYKFPTEPGMGVTGPTLDTEVGPLYMLEGMNPAEARMFIENTRDTGWWEDYRSQDLAAQYDASPYDLSGSGKMFGVQRPDGTYFDPIEVGGMPSNMMWEKDNLTGEWQKKPEDEIFDDLYRLNGIDPEDDEMVELFWAFASDDMLYMAEFFEVIDWPAGGSGYSDAGGYGGYGFMPTPYAQYRAGGQRPARGDYASYLSLTSWSI